MVDGIITGTTVPCFACQKWSGTTNQSHVKSTTAVLVHKKKSPLTFECHLLSFCIAGKSFLCADELVLNVTS